MAHTLDARSEQIRTLAAQQSHNYEQLFRLDEATERHRICEQWDLTSETRRNAPMPATAESLLILNVEEMLVDQCLELNDQIKRLR